MTKKFEQDQLSILEMSKVAGARSKTVISVDDGNGNCVTSKVIDDRHGHIKRIVMKECK